MEHSKKTKGDVAHTMVKAGLSTIPIFGGPAAELFQTIVQPPLEKRRVEWMESVGERLEKLESEGFSVEDLQKNEQFISIVMIASQAALRTHQGEKLMALKNAIVNVAKGHFSDDTLQHLFLNMIDSFTELHIKVLKVFQSPSTPPNLSMGGLSNVLVYNFPELNDQRDVYDQIWKDLYSKGLVSTSNLHTTMSGHGLMAKRTTKIGDQFIAFIEDQPDS